MRRRLRERPREVADTGGTLGREVWAEIKLQESSIQREQTRYSQKKLYRRRKEFRVSEKNRGRREDVTRGPSSGGGRSCGSPDRDAGFTRVTLFPVQVTVVLSFLSVCVCVCVLIFIGLCWMLLEA